MPLFPNSSPFKPRGGPPPADPLRKIAEDKIRQQRQQQLGQAAGQLGPNGKPPATVGAGPQRPVRLPNQPASDPNKAAVDAIRGIGGGGGGRHVDPNAPPRDVRQDAINRLDQQQKAERDATMQQLVASKAQQQQNAAARSGLGGFGLSGASATLQGDTARVADRNATLALADLDKRQRGEQFDAIKRQEAIDDLETSEDRDVDHDGFIAGQKVGGKIGDGNPDNNPADNPVDAAAQAKEDAAKARGNFEGDGGDISPYTGTAEDAQNLLDADPSFHFDKNDARIENDHGTYFVVVRGSDGKLYKIQVDESDVADDFYVYDNGKHTLENAGLA